MSNLFGLIEIGKHSLFAHQTALGVINHNIANANTPGFSRQRVDLTARSSVLGLYGNIGGGVDVRGLQRITDEFLLGQIGRTRADYGEQYALSTGLNALEVLFGEPVDDVLGDSGLSDVINDFLDSWQPVINPEMEADGADMRGLIIEAARLLTQRFNTLSGGIVEQASALEADLGRKIDKVNSLIDSVADLNVQISNQGIADAARNDLTDQRDLALQRLAELVGAEWGEDENGKLRVYAGGFTLVDHANAHHVTLSLEGEASDRLRPASLGMLNGSVRQNAPGGEIRGLMRMLNEEIPEFLGRLDQLASQLSAKVNAIHQASTGDGGGGVDIFVGDNASNIAVNPVLLSHPEMLSLTGILPDGRDIASAIFDLHQESITEENGLSLEGLYSTMVGELGARSASAQNMGGAADRMLTGLEQKHAAAAGVNIDEELANMMVVQTSFQAASKVINLVDDLLATVLTLL